MGHLALFLMVVVIVPCLISVHGRGSHNAVVQKIAGIEQFVPPPEGCVAWVTLDASKGCTWCQSMFRQLLQALIRSYHPIEHFYSPAALVASHNSKHRDMKGTCFINYLVTDNYKGLRNIFNPKALSKIRTKNWIVFIEGEKTSHFLKCWANTIDANFGFVFPKVVLMMMHPMRTENDGYALTSDLPGTGLETFNNNNGRAAFRAAVACYMCPEGKSYFVGIQQGDKNPYNLLKKSGDRRGNLGPPGISLESTYFNARKPESSPYIGNKFFRDTVLDIVQVQLNFTFVEGYPKSGIIIETVWSETEDTKDLPSFKSAPVKRVFLYKNAFSLVYCRTEYTNKYVAALVSPLNSALWAVFLVSVISICLVAGVRFWGGLDFFWLMQGQPPQAKKISALIILATIILIPVQILYKEYYASNAMTPFAHEFLETNQEVFNAEFRLICPDISQCVKNAEWWLSTINLHVDWNATRKYFIGPEELGTTPYDEKSLALGRDRATTYESRNIKDLVIIEQESYVLGTKCDMAEDYWWARRTTWQFTGPLSKAMHDTIQMLREVGIINFWQKVPIAAERRRKKSQMQPPQFDPDEVEAYESGTVHMNSTLMSLVVLYLGLCALAIICLLAEMMSAKIVARWKRWRERRRYLRAIWPLGKI